MNKTLIIDPFQTYGQTMNQIHSYSTVPALIFFWISSFVIFLIVGLTMLDKEKSNMMKWFSMWFVYTLLTGLVLVWFCYSPNSIQVMKDFFIGFFKF